MRPQRQRNLIPLNKNVWMMPFFFCKHSNSIHKTQSFSKILKPKHLLQFAIRKCPRRNFSKKQIDLLFRQRRNAAFTGNAMLFHKLIKEIPKYKLIGEKHINSKIYLYIL